jgi:hypothetical protein
VHWCVLPVGSFDPATNEQYPGGAVLLVLVGRHTLDHDVVIAEG